MGWLRKIRDWCRREFLGSALPYLDYSESRSRILRRAKPREELPPWLQGLHDRMQQVPWKRLAECYGPADTVPVLLLELAAEDEDVRKEAYHELTSRIWHQHTIYEASAHAVPFLVDLAQSPDMPERWRAVSILGLLAMGWGYYQVHAPGDKRHARKIRIEEQHVAAVKAQLRSQAMAFDAWKDDRDPLVRRFALELLDGLERR